MTSPFPFEHPGPPPARPELPEGVHRPDDGGLPAWPAWAPFAALLLALVISIAGALVVSVIVSLAGVDITGHTPAGVKIAGTVVQDAGLIAAAVVFARITAARVAAADFGLRPARFWPAVGWVAAAFATFIVATLVYALLVNPPTVSEQAQDLGAGESTVNLIAVTVLVTVIAPFAEEFFFRGFLFTALWRALGWVGGAVISGAVFAAIHVGSLQAIFLPALVLLGFLLAVVYRRTGSILPCMALHAINNSLAMGQSQHLSAVATVALMIGAPTVVVSIGLAVSRSRRLNSSAAAA